MSSLTDYENDLVDKYGDSISHVINEIENLHI